MSGEEGREIRSGDWANLDDAVDYRQVLLGDMLVERLVWGDRAGARMAGRCQVAGPGYIWFRFWLPQQDQVVARYFDGAGGLVCTHVDVCGPLQRTVGGWTARDLLLDLRLMPDGRVIMGGEGAFNGAAADGRLSAADIAYAEQHVRALTGAIAAGRFPPALVRQWQIDINRIREELGP